MFGRLSAKMMMVGALMGLLLTGCGANPYGYDPYAEAYGYGSDAYGSAYSGDVGYDSGYDTGYDSGYGSDYSSDYGSDYSSDYGSDYGSGYDTGYDTGYGSPSPAPSASAVAPLPPTDQLPALSAWVEDVKETGFMGMGKVIAKVAVENPSSRTLSGRLEVRFTDNGNLTANKATERITLGPREKQVLTFTANAWRLDDAEAIVTTDRNEDTGSGTGGSSADDGGSEVRDAD